MPLFTEAPLSWSRCPEAWAPHCAQRLCHGRRTQSPPIERVNNSCPLYSQVPTAPAASGAKKSAFGDSPGRPGGDGDGDAPAEGRRGRRRAADDDDEQVEEAPTRHNIASMDDPDEETTFIPDLEDEEEDLGKQVAVAPSLKSSRVQTIAELDEEIDMALPSSSEVGVDLAVLQSFLTPQEHCLEEDVPWDVEHELQMIASEMTKEHEEREGNVLPGQVSPKRKKAPKDAVADVA